MNSILHPPSTSFHPPADPHRSSHNFSLYLMICLSFTSSASTNQASIALMKTESRKCSPSALEKAVCARTDKEAVQIFESDDAILLHCHPVENDEQIFGFSNPGALVHVTILEPYKCIRLVDKDIGCCCEHPGRDWTRRKILSNYGLTSTEKELNIIDLTGLQIQRRKNFALYPSFDSPGKVFHLLRSILTCQSGLHCASPWYGQSSCSHDKAVALLVNNSTRLEGRELNELINFRTGDAAPSYYLHSITKLGARCAESDEKCHVGSLLQFFQSETISDTTMLVFRHLPARDALSVKEPKRTDSTSSPPIVDNAVFRGCMWERYVQVQPDTTSDESDQETPTTEKVTKHRMISPPYISCEEEYTGIIDTVLMNIDQVKQEATIIPQWTAWPERNHYSSSTNTDNDNPYAAWTVFPLCHTFPADDVSQRIFIEKTCSFVPKTTALLKNIGPKLRTALFSRLDKRTTLGTHTGWSDLANHVFRVHIPLVVPLGGSCGTWVDGW